MTAATQNQAWLPPDAKDGITMHRPAPPEPKWLSIEQAKQLEANQTPCLVKIAGIKKTDGNAVRVFFKPATTLDWDKTSVEGPWDYWSGLMKKLDAVNYDQLLGKHVWVIFTVTHNRIDIAEIYLAHLRPANAVPF